jgi:hypothetical protein
MEAVMSAQDSITPEVWRPVVGYEGLYEVSDRGNVRSLTRHARVGHNAFRSVRGRMVAQSSHKHGYLVVALQRGNKGRTFLAHRIVASAFIGPIPEGTEVNHKDGDKRNNRPGNLEIVTRQQNIDHAVTAGIIDNKGGRNTQAVLCLEQVNAIREEYKRGLNGYKALGKMYGVSWGTIRGIIKWHTWGWVTHAGLHEPG